LQLHPKLHQTEYNNIDSVSGYHRAFTFEAMNIAIRLLQFFSVCISACNTQMFVANG